MHASHHLCKVTIDTITLACALELKVDKPLSNFHHEDSFNNICD